MKSDNSFIDWEAVYRELVSRVYNFFRYRTGDKQIAQDLTAQTWLKAWRYRHRYTQDKGTFSAWLFQIARNVAADYHAQHMLDLTLTDDIPSLESVEHEVQAYDDAARLYALLRQLPIREQEIIALKYGAEQTNRAIAVMLDLNESNVSTILGRTLAKLRVAWDSPLPLLGQ